MTSSPLFFDLLKENLKRRLWGIALSCLTFFFALPVPFLLAATSYLAPERLGTFQETISPDEGLLLARESLYRELTDLAGSDSINFLLLCLAGTLVISGFSYLQQKNRTDFLHSLPVGRAQLYAAVSLNTFLIAAVPYLFMSLLSGVVLQVYSRHPESVPFLLSQAFLHLAFYLLFQAVFTLAVMMTGHLAVSLMASGVFFFLPVLLSAIGPSILETFFKTYCYRSAFWKMVSQFCSPFSLSLDVCLPSGPRAAAAFFSGVLLLFLSLVLYRIRPSEAAGRAMAFRRTEGPVKVLVTVPLSIAGLLIMNAIQGDSDAWMLFGLFSALLLTGCFMEIIYHFDFRKLFSGKKALLTAAALSLGIFAFFRFDLSGYDRYLPAEDDIVSAGIMTGYLEPDQRNYHYRLSVTDKPGTFYVNTEQGTAAEELILKMHLACTEDVRSIAEHGIYKLSVEEQERTASARPGGEVLVAWHLKNGKHVLRSYSYDLERIQGNLDRVWDDPAYRETMYPLFGTESSDLSGINFQDALRLDHVPGTAGDSPEAVRLRTELFEAYKEEFSKLSAETRHRESPAGCLQFKTKSFQETADLLRKHGQDLSFLNEYDYYPVYPSFQKTIAALSKCGVTLNEDLKPGPVAAAVLSNIYVKGRADDRLTPLTVTEEEWLSELLSAAVPVLNCQNPMRPLSKNFDIQLRLKAPDHVSGGLATGSEGDFPSEDTEPSVNLRLPADQVPEFVRKHFAPDGETLEEDPDRWWY